jgi:DNA anti-recombination protein RmuC
MSRREKVEELLADVLPKIEALKAEALDSIAEVRRDANEKLHRHEEATAELALVEEEIESLRAEREGLPDRAYRAGLDEEYALEDELKERYKNLKPAIEHLEERRRFLEAEKAELLPRDHGHRNDARIHHVARVAGTAHEERRALEDMRERFVKALEDAVKPVAKLHEDNKAQVEAWGTEREWDPEFRERAYGRPA